MWNLGYTAIEGAMQILTQDCCLPSSFSSTSYRQQKATENLGSISLAKPYFHSRASKISKFNTFAL